MRACTRDGRSLARLEARWSSACTHGGGRRAGHDHAQCPERSQLSHLTAASRQSTLDRGFWQYGCKVQLVINYHVSCRSVSSLDGGHPMRGRVPQHLRADGVRTVPAQRRASRRPSVRPGLLRVIRFLPLNWEQLAADIETGTLSPRVTDASVREAVADILRPDRSSPSSSGTSAATVQQRLRRHHRAHLAEHKIP